MSLATRCTSCGTVFRVVQDQLKVSEGWVRCGRCESVFNALEGLLDLDREAPTGWDEAELPPGAPPQPVDEPDEQPAPSAEALAPIGRTTAADAPAPMPVQVKVEHRQDEGSPSIPNEFLADPIDAHLFGPRKRTESAPKPAGQLGARDRVEFSDARFDSDLFPEHSVPDEPESADPTTVAADLRLESTARPEFVRRADRHARWRTGPMRLLLMLGVVVAGAALALQAGHHYRDSLAAEWPSLRPALSAWCSLAACSLEAPRRIDDVSVESTALARAVGFDAYVLSVTLRNRGAFALAVPAVDLKLTDGNGRLVARRVLPARDFRASAQLGAGAELPLQLTLATGSTPVAGYTVEIFYP